MHKNQEIGSMFNPAIGNNLTAMADIEVRIPEALLKAIDTLLQQKKSRGPASLSKLSNPITVNVWWKRLKGNWRRFTLKTG